MAAKSRSDIIGDIEDHVHEHAKGKFGSWVVGLSSQPKTALTDTHKVKAGKHPYIVRRAKSPEEAVEVVQYLSSVKGMKQAADIDPAAVHIYAYLTSFRTKP